MQTENFDLFKQILHAKTTEESLMADLLRKYCNMWT